MGDAPCSSLTRSERFADAPIVGGTALHKVSSYRGTLTGVFDPYSIDSAEVAAAFASYDDAVRIELLALRQLILDTAAATPGVGAIEETLKWGQPAYLTNETRSGSTIRIAPTGSKLAHDYAMFFICHTNLVETFELLFGETFTYDGKRALLFTVGESIPGPELEECVAMAQTYHLNRA